MVAVGMGVMPRNAARHEWLYTSGGCSEAIDPWQTGSRSPYTCCLLLLHQPSPCDVQLPTRTLSFSRVTSTDTLLYLTAKPSGNLGQEGTSFVYLRINKIFVYRNERCYSDLRWCVLHSRNLTRHPHHSLVLHTVRPEANRLVSTDSYPPTRDTSQQASLFFINIAGYRVPVRSDRRNTIISVSPGI